MRLLRYSLLILFLPSFSYAVYWTQFRPDHTSPVPAIFVVALGLCLFASTVYLVVVKTHDIKKLGLGGQLQKPEH